MCLRLTWVRLHHAPERISTALEFYADICSFDFQYFLIETDLGVWHENGLVCVNGSAWGRGVQQSRRLTLKIWSFKDWLYWLTAISMKDDDWRVTSDPLNEKWVTNVEPSSTSTNQVHIVQRFHHRHWCHSHLRHSGDSSWGPAIQFCKLIHFRMNRSTSKID